MNPDLGLRRTKWMNFVMCNYSKKKVILCRIKMKSNFEMVVPWCSVYQYCTNSFNRDSSVKADIVQCLEPQIMVLLRNREFAHFFSINLFTKAIHHYCHILHHHHHNHHHHHHHKSSSYFLQVWCHFI